MNKILKKTVLLLLITLIISSTFIVASGNPVLYQHSIVVTGYFGKSSSQSTSTLPLGYMAVTTYLYCSGQNVGLNIEQQWGEVVCGWVNSYFSGIGTKWAKGRHVYADSSYGINYTTWTAAN